MAHLSISSVVLTSVLCFISCNGAPDNKLVGRWKYESIQQSAGLTDDDAKKLDSLNKDIIQVFNADGKYFTIDNGKDTSEKGEYKMINGDTSIVLFSGESKSISDTAKITEINSHSFKIQLPRGIVVMKRVE